MTQPGSCEQSPSGLDWGHWKDTLDGLLETKPDLAGDDLLWFTWGLEGIPTYDLSASVL